MKSQSHLFSIWFPRLFGTKFFGFNMPCFCWQASYNFTVWMLLNVNWCSLNVVLLGIKMIPLHPNVLKNDLNIFWTPIMYCMVQNIKDSIAKYKVPSTSVPKPQFLIHGCKILLQLFSIFFHSYIYICIFKTNDIVL